MQHAIPAAQQQNQGDNMSDSNDNSTDDRRAFLKGAVLAAGVTVAVAAEGQQEASKLLSTGRSVALAVKGGIKAPTVHAALDRVFRLAGCPTCGLNGILDLRINVVNPVIPDQFAREGLVGISENLGQF
jgi:hypothetical protein